MQRIIISRQLAHINWSLFFDLAWVIWSLTLAAFVLADFKQLTLNAAKPKASYHILMVEAVNIMLNEPSMKCNQYTSFHSWSCFRKTCGKQRETIYIYQYSKREIFIKYIMWRADYITEMQRFSFKKKKKIIITIIIRELKTQRNATVMSLWSCRVQINTTEPIMGHYIYMPVSIKAAAIFKKQEQKPN